MKTLALNIVFVFVSIIQLSAMTAPKTASLVVYGSEKSIILNLTGSVSAVEVLTISDLSGKVVFEDQISKYDNGVKYNLEKLAIGDYVIKIKGDDYKEYIETSVTKDKVILGKSVYYFKPILRVEDNRLLLDAWFENEEDFGLRIYDGEGELVYEYTEKRKGGFHKSFNLENLKEAEYSVFVSTSQFREATSISL